MQTNRLEAGSDSFFFIIEAQVNTQQYGRRPYGVGLLVIGHDVSSFLCLWLIGNLTCVSVGNWTSSF